MSANQATENIQKILNEELSPFKQDSYPYRYASLFLYQYGNKVLAGVKSPLIQEFNRYDNNSIIERTKLLKALLAEGTISEDTIVEMADAYVKINRINH